MNRVCRHCEDPARSVNRPRGLCWTCYYTPGVKEQYPPTGKYTRRGVGNPGRSLARPQPTAASPGSEGKLAVLEGRAERGEDLWHPDDTTDQG